MNAAAFLVVHEDESDLVPVPTQTFHQPIDAVSGQSEDGVDSPERQAVDECLRGDLRHKTSSPGF